MTEKVEIAQWADLFPHIKNHATEDPRIFQTPWTKNKDKTKTKKFFACVVGGTCYGVDVIKPWATKSEKEEREALDKMQQACYHMEQHGEWPK